MELNQYISENYEYLKKALRSIAKDADNSTYEELYHHCLLIFLEHKKSQIAVDNNQGQFFLARIMLNQWRTNRSDFKRYYQKNVELTHDNNEYIDYEYDYDKDILIEKMINALNIMFNKGGFSKNRATIIIYYYSSNCNFNEVERKYNIKNTTVRASFLKGIEELKKIINNNDYINWTTGIQPTWDLLGSDIDLEAISNAARLFQREK